MSGQAANESARKRTIARVVREVAGYPRVIRHYENGRTIAAVLGDLGRDSGFGATRTAPKAPS